MAKQENMNVCEEFSSLSHVDCGKCYSEDVFLLGTYQIDGNGFFVDVKCNSCGKKSETGDGEFLTEVAHFDGEKFLELVKN